MDRTLKRARRNNKRRGQRNLAVGEVIGIQTSHRDIGMAA